MRLTKLAITNFRSIGGTATIEVPSRHLALVGSNNAGKSNIVSALDWVLGARTPYRLNASPDDFFDQSSPIVIEATIGDFTTVDKSHLMSIATSKQQRGALSKKTDAEVVLTVTIPPVEASPTDVEETDGQDESMPTVTRPTLSLSLWGFAVHQKAAEIRGRIVQLVRVAAERKVEDDLSASRWTPYGQLMKTILEASPQYEDLKKLLQDINAKIQEVFSEQKESLIADANVVSYVEDIAFQLTRENNPAELLRYLEILVTEDGRQSNLTKLGTGTQSAVIIGMLELVLRARTGHVKIFAVEEPDAFIHPHGVRHLAGLVRRIGEDLDSQVVLTTHSPALLATLTPQDIVRVEKRDGRTVATQSPGTLGDPVFVRYVDRDTAEMFFAQRVILVEGATERFLLPPLSALLSDGGKSLDFDRRQTSVIAMNTKDNIVNFLRILDEFEIEARAILDHDFLAGSSCRSLVTYLRARSHTIDDSSTAQLTKGLWKCGVCVLGKGEIENYVPEADVAVITGRTEADVQSELTSATKASKAFEKLFRASKPMYARQIAEHYVGAGAVPAELEKLIRKVSK